VLVNVHDPGSAVIAQAAGAVALGTTSSGHAYSLARRDALGALSRVESIERVHQICSAVDVPVSVDAENGWGTSPDDVADTIRTLAAAGAAEPLDEAITRPQLFRDAGADCLYAPGPTDLVSLARIVAETGAPVNALIGFGSRLTVSDAARVGVRRVSVGGSLYRATMAKFRELVTQLVTTGSLTSEPPPIPDTELDHLFRG
jgi:2-methylisocitrate lyase-like PEP mutase family enzyme